MSERCLYLMYLGRVQSVFEPSQTSAQSCALMLLRFAGDYARKAYHVLIAGCSTEYRFCGFVRVNCMTFSRLSRSLTIKYATSSDFGGQHFTSTHAQLKFGLSAKLVPISCKTTTTTLLASHFIQLGVQPIVLQIV